MDRAQSLLKASPMDVDLASQAAKATEIFWDVARWEEASLPQKSRRSLDKVFIFELFCTIFPPQAPRTIMELLLCKIPNRQSS
ncbi:unnamed protein product [Citrullus colocynthis]|uniref:Uncharacterized protein n=1 Tax=Citrullus colocynthis TaxID=252529 RepID=A0ABP0YGE0_9ROSI